MLSPSTGAALIGSFNHDWMARKNEAHEIILFLMNIAAIGNDCAIMLDASLRFFAGACLYGTTASALILDMLLKNDFRNRLEKDRKVRTEKRAKGE